MGLTSTSWSPGWNILKIGFRRSFPRLTSYTDSHRCYADLRTWYSHKRGTETRLIEPGIWKYAELRSSKMWLNIWFDVMGRKSRSCLSRSAQVSRRLRNARDFSGASAFGSWLLFAWTSGSYTNNRTHVNTVQKSSPWGGSAHMRDSGGGSVRLQRSQVPERPKRPAHFKIFHLELIEFTSLPLAFWISRHIKNPHLHFVRN